MIEERYPDESGWGLLVWQDLIIGHICDEVDEAAYRRCVNWLVGMYLTVVFLTR